jgi:hypothetical protein
MSIKNWISRSSILIFFIGTYFLSWLGAYLIVFPELIHGEPIYGRLTKGGPCENRGRTKTNSYNRN